MENDDHRWGAFDISTGEFRVPLQWKRLEHQSWKCRLLVMDDERRWGALDNFGKTLLPRTFSSESTLKATLEKIDSEREKKKKD